MGYFEVPAVSPEDSDHIIRDLEDHIPFLEKILKANELEYKEYVSKNPDVLPEEMPFEILNIKENIAARTKKLNTLKENLKLELDRKKIREGNK